MERLSIIRFVFDIKEEGVALAKFLIGDADDEEEEFELTNICDPISDLLRGLVTLINKHKTGDVEEDNKYVVTWYNDNECFNWDLSLNSDNYLAVRITESNSFFGDEVFEAVNTSCPINDFLIAIVSELDSFIKRVGLLKYLELWGNNEFPLTYLLFLKEYLIRQGAWQIDNSSVSEELSKECNLLLK
ncbi:MAG: hypothetical protein J6Y72_08655 [Bacteroidales bacterium]|nr:hypothetical protein [Bacteroidales bacterium]